MNKRGEGLIDRKTLAIIVLAVLLAVTLSLLAYTVVTGEMSKSVSSFTQSADGLDYSDEANWHQLPVESQAGALNVFVIYPTVTAKSQNTPYILDQNDPDMLAGAGEFLSQSITPIFDGLQVNIYVPKYRQYNGAYYTGNSYEQAFSEISGLPRTDIYNAFDYFLKHYNGSSEYLIIGHSQGAALASFLVSDFATRFASQATQDRMALAVIAGWGLVDTIVDNSPYSFSKSPTDKNVILSWNTATAEEVHGDYDRFTWGDKTTLCTNPTTFTGDDSDTAQVVRPTDLGGSFPGEVLLINEPDSGFTTDDISAVMDSANLGHAHLYDLSLFASNIKANLQTRLRI
jgi:hypothetical protein